MYVCIIYVLYIDMYMCVHTYIYIYIYICAYVCVDMYDTYIYIYKYICSTINDTTVATIALVVVIVMRVTIP